MHLRRIFVDIRVSPACSEGRGRMFTKCFPSPPPRLGRGLSTHVLCGKCSSLCHVVTNRAHHAGSDDVDALHAGSYHFRCIVFRCAVDFLGTSLASLAWYQLCKGVHLNTFTRIDRQLTLFLGVVLVISVYHRVGRTAAAEHGCPLFSLPGGCCTSSPLDYHQDPQLLPRQRWHPPRGFPLPQVQVAYLNS